MLTMKYNKDLETFNFQAFFERRRRNRENGIKRKVDRMLKEERMDIIIAVLSEEMETMARFSSHVRTIQTRRHSGGDEGGVSTYYQAN